MLFNPTPSNISQADILLINPDFSKNELGIASPPENHLGLNRIAGFLKFKGHTSQVIDTTGMPSSTKGPEKLGDWLTQNGHKYSSIGFHTNSWNVNYILRILARAKDSLKEIKLLFGGPLPTTEPNKLLNLLIDKGHTNVGLVQGFGEKVTAEILSSDRLIDVKGLWVFENGKIQEGCKLSLTEPELDALPFLDLEHNSFYQNYYKPVIDSGDLGEYELGIIFGSQGLEVNRGCPFNCTYCNVPQYKEKLISFSARRVADELEYLAEEGGFFMFKFSNSNIMFMHAEWIRELCEEIIRRGMNDYLDWNAYHHPSIIAGLDVEDYKLMSRAGSNTIIFGVQSFDKKLLKIFSRPINTPELTKIIHEKTRQAKQEITIDYITGMPGEDFEVIQEAFQYYAANNIECRNFHLIFYPNTKLSTMDLNLSNHELVPITGNLAPELEACALVNNKPDKRSAELDAFIRRSNKRIVENRPMRLGKYIVNSAETANHLLLNEIPNNPNIPDKVKTAMTIILREMLNPQKRRIGIDSLDPTDKMMEKVIEAGDDAPPLIKVMQKKLLD